MHFKRILIPVDFTEKNLEAFAAAKGIVSANEGELVLLHVIEELDVPRQELEDFYSNLEDSAQVRIQDYADRLQDEGWTVETSICFGKRVAEIVGFTATNHVDLVILTSHKLDPGNLSRSLMTISHQVAIAAQAPVLLLR